MDETLRSLLARTIPHLEDYAVEERPLAELNSKRQILEASHHGVISRSQAAERLFLLTHRELREVPIKKRRYQGSDYGYYDQVDEQGEPIAQHLTGSEEGVIIVHSSSFTRPKGPHTFKKVIEIYRR